MTITNRPLIIGNMAMSLDGKIAPAIPAKVAISSEIDFKRRDQIRYEVDAVLVGGRTLEIDEPSLKIYDSKLVQKRLENGLSAQPLGIAISSTCQISEKSNFFTSATEKRVILTTERAQSQDVLRLSDLANVYIVGKERVDLKKAMEILFLRGVHRLMVEGGGTLMFEMIRARLIDEFYISVNSIILGGQTAPNPVDGVGFSYPEAPRPQLIDVIKQDDTSVLLHYRF